MNSKAHRERLLLATALTAFVLATPSFAQQADAAPQEAAAAAHAEEAGIGDIVVTATRRASSLQRTPIAISALDANLIERAAPRDLGDLAKFTPNFSAAEIPGFNAASFAMRGVGQTNIIVYFEAPVAVLVDDFVVPSVQTQLLDTFDVDQIEVLRGPQGTLFGKNTTGGAVIVRTKRPVLDETSVQLRASYGSFSDIKLNGAVNIPIAETLSLRLVAGYQNSDGYMRNGAAYGPITTPVPSKFDGLAGAGGGERVGGKDVFSGRAKLLWEPTSNVSALLQYEMLRDRSASPVSVHTTPDNSTFLFGRLGLAQDIKGDPLKLGGVSNRSGYLVGVDKGHRIDVDGIYLNVDVDTEVGRFSSVTGYRNQFSSLANSYPSVAPVAADGEILSLFDANRTDKHKTFQQELRFASNFGGPVDFVAGGFYSKDKIAFCVAQLLGFQDLVGSTTPFGPWNNNPYALCSTQNGEAKALFSEATVKFTDALTLSGGFRYTWENKTWRGRQQVFIQDLPGTRDPSFTYQNLGGLLDAADFDRFPAGVVQVKGKWKQPTWRVSLGYQAAPNIFGYATYSRGFKSGAFNDQIGTFGAFGTNLDAFREAATPTDPEKADSYEIGVKTDLFDRRVRFNLTGFYVDYSDVQKQINVPLIVNGQDFQVTRFVNAAKMTVKGIELESTVLPADGFTLRGVLGYQKGSYSSFSTPLPAGYDLATAPLDRAPKWQWAVDATYEHSLPSIGKLTFNGNLSYTGKNLYNLSIVSPAMNTFLDAHKLVSASITLADENNDRYVRLVGKNLTDTRYLVASQIVGTLWTTDRYGPPRTVAVEVGMRF